jgi:hypothetical protein
MTLSVSIYYYYSKKKAREPVSHAHAITSVTSGSGTSVTVRAVPVTWLPVTSLPVAPPLSTSRNVAWTVLIYYSCHKKTV